MYDHGRGKKEARDFDIDFEEKRTGTIRVNAQSRAEAELEAQKRVAAKSKDITWNDKVVTQIIETREAGW